MYKDIKLKPPFFELGPKAYLFGKSSLEMALAADRISADYDVQIIYTPQYADIYPISKKTEHLLVFAQHMDALAPGRGLGSVLPESLKAAGAIGVMLNHCEKPCSLNLLHKTIRRADELELLTIVCADTPIEAAAIAHLEPNIILPEPPDLIGKDASTSQKRDFILSSNKLIHTINPKIQILHSAGIRSGDDVAELVQMGAQAVGSTSGVLKADNPIAKLEEMIKALRQSWDQIN